MRPVGELFQLPGYRNYDIVSKVISLSRHLHLDKKKDQYEFLKKLLLFRLSGEVKWFLV